ncbi:MAG: Holliday junction branch migration protein RuvA [Cellvibrionaceae bacterium]|nr:Holliday junction branch migration protein RuvA [Cellvibrionaceae bacterium]
MIGRLRGVLLEKQPPHLLVDVHGVGYDLLAPMTTFYSLPELGAEVVLHTHFSVSENAQQLFAFINKEDRALFRQLIKVSNVGPKMALGILSGMDSSEFVRSVMNNNLNALVQVPGVGKKTAERLIVEMRDRLRDWSAAADGPVPAPIKAAVSAENQLVADAESALISLGYKPVEAAKAINAVLSAHSVERSEDLIRLALRSMMPK